MVKKVTMMLFVDIVSQSGSRGGDSSVVRAPDS